METVFFKILMDPAITHMAMATADDGKDAYVAIASGQCSQTAKLLPA
jgi:hypothetical protein